MRYETLLTRISIQCLGNASVGLTKETCVNIVVSFADVIPRNTSILRRQARGFLEHCDLEHGQHGHGSLCRLLAHVGVQRNDERWPDNASDDLKALLAQRPPDLGDGDGEYLRAAPEVRDQSTQTRQMKAVNKHNVNSKGPATTTSVFQRNCPRSKERDRQL